MNSKYSALELQQFHDESDLMHEVASKVRRYVPGELDWIVKQDTSDGENVYGFVIGKGFASCAIDEARHSLEDDVFIRRLAAEILGFPVDSPQDAARRLDEASDELRRIENQMNGLRNLWVMWANRWNTAKDLLKTPD